MKITLAHKKSFGRSRLYPACDRSRLLIKLMWDPFRKRCRTTFTEGEYELLLKIGFEIELIGEPYEQNKEGRIKNGQKAK